MSLNLLRYFALRSLLNSKARSLLTLLGVALGIALQSGIESINRSTLASFRESVEATVGKASLSITAGETGFDEKTEDQVRTVPGVRSTAPMIEAHLFYKTPSGAEPIVLFGIDLLKEQSVRSYKTDDSMIDDPLEFLNQPDSIILTREFAQAHHLKVGDPIELTTAHGSQRFVVRGLLSPEGPAKAYGGGIAVMDIDGARVSLGKENKDDRIDLVLKEGADRDSVREAVKKVLGPGFQVQTPESQTEQLHSVVAAFQGMLAFMSALALVIGLFLVFNSVSVSVAERRRDIGSLRALGATRGEVLAVIILENVVLGAAAGLLGAFLGDILARVLATHVAAAMSSQAVTRIQISRIEFGAHEVLLALLLGTGVSVVAALRPAIRAMAISPVEALRPKGVGAPQPVESARRRALPGVGVALLAALVLFKIPALSRAFPPEMQGAVNLLQPILGIAGAILVTPVVSKVAVSLLLKLVSKRNGWVPMMAFENLLRNPNRTLSNVLSTLIGLMLVVIVGAVHVSFRETLTSWLDRVMATGDMSISSNGKLSSLQVQPLREDIVQDIRKVPGVDLSEEHPVILLRYLRQDYQGRSLAIKAIDPISEKSRFSFIDAVDIPPLEAGRRLFSPDSRSVLVSENFARNFSRKNGDTITLLTPSGPLQLTIAGIVRDLANPDGVFYLNRSLLKRYWKDSLVTVFFVTAAPGETPEKLQARFNSTLGSRGIITTLNRTLVDDLMKTVDQSFSFNAIIELAALLVGLIALINTMLVSVLERTREFGMLRAVGMERKQMATMIFWECVAQGALGAVAAVILGSYLSWLWVTVNLSTALGWLIPFVFPTAAVLQVFVLGVVVAAVAGVLPALRASRLELRTALEHE